MLQLVEPAERAAVMVEPHVILADELTPLYVNGVHSPEVPLSACGLVSVHPAFEYAVKENVSVARAWPMTQTSSKAVAFSIGLEELGEAERNVS